MTRDMGKDLLDLMAADVAAGMSGTGAAKEIEQIPEVGGRDDVLHEPDENWRDRINWAIKDIFPVALPPLDHQLLALTEADLKPAHAYWMDAGAGKTFTCIAESGLLFNRDQIDGVIVIAPNGPHRQWIRKELPKWAKFPWRGVWSGALKRDSRQFWESERTDILGVFAIHYEGLATKEVQENLAKFFKRFPRVMLIVDESQKTKGHKAKRTHLVAGLARQSVFVRVLSGTPLLKGLEDLFTQYYILQPGITGAFNADDVQKNWIACRGWYCQTERPSRNSPEWAKKIVGYKNEGEFRKRVRPYSTRVTQDMFMKREEPDFMPVDTPMTPRQASLYEKMRKDLVIHIEQGAVTAKNALVALNKMSQIATGFIYDGDGQAEWISRNKIDATLTLLESIREPFIIWAPDRALQDKLEEEIRKNFDTPLVRYTKPEDVDTWMDQQGWIMGNQSSGLGVGMNLQMAAAAAYVRNLFHSEARWQSLRRIDRIGQERQCRYWDMITPGSCEIRVMDRLAQNEEMARLNVDVLKTMAL